MDKNSVTWKDLWVAIVTPFDAAGAIDEDALRAHVDWCIAEGVSGIVASGCTGEFWALTDDERKRVIKACVETAAGRVPGRRHRRHPHRGRDRAQRLCSPSGVRRRDDRGAVLRQAER